MGQPEGLDLLDGGEELVEANRLRHVRIRVEVVGAKHVRFG
jgi:hypothetical protein